MSANAHPMDRDYLREMAKVLSDKLPDKHGFILFAFQFDNEGRDPRTYYISNAERASAIAAIKEWLIKAGAGEDWMKHIT